MWLRTMTLISRCTEFADEPQSLLVNTARGPIVDEKALVVALQNGEIVEQLDVYEQEPALEPVFTKWITSW